MTSDAPRARPVPGHRVSRLARLTGLAAGVAGHSALRGGRALLSGERPTLRDMVLTPENARRLTEQLSEMRGAAMKVGQLLSMEASDLLPPELSQILARLRADAHHMPPSQLKKVLSQNWGSDFLQHFSHFDVHPIAAASIGQVHRAETRDGRRLAIKIQYPGVRQSIDSDVRNVGALIRLSGLTPDGIDLAPLLDEARAQLHDEADYEREGRALSDFGARLEGDDRYIVPALHADLTTKDILAMDFVDGISLDETLSLDQEVRDRIATSLIALLLRELFTFRAMQTDPNFANYRYQPDTGRIVLLDFGASRDFPEEMVRDYLKLLRAGLAEDRTAIRKLLIRIGFFGEDLPAEVELQVQDIFAIAMEPIRTAGPIDFGAFGLTTRLREAGIAMAEDRKIFPVPPIDTLLLQRKIAGTLFLVERLSARVRLEDEIRPYT